MIIKYLLPDHVALMEFWHYVQYSGKKKKAQGIDNHITIFCNYNQEWAFDYGHKTPFSDKWKSAADVIGQAKSFVLGWL